MIAVLAAVNHRDSILRTGQHLDIALLDAHVASNVLVSGTLPRRTGTASEIKCPYQAFKCADGALMMAVGNDAQFVGFCAIIDLRALPLDPRYATNPERACHRATLVPIFAAHLRTASATQWAEQFTDAGVPCGPINDLAQMFAEPHVKHREIVRSMPHPSAGTIPIIANPVRFWATPVEYHRPPPLLGEHTREVLRDVLKLSDAEFDRLAAEKIT